MADRPDPCKWSGFTHFVNGQPLVSREVLCKEVLPSCGVESGPCHLTAPAQSAPAHGTCVLPSVLLCAPTAPMAVLSTRQTLCPAQPRLYFAVCL